MVVVSGPLLLQSAPFEMILVFVPSFGQELELPMLPQSGLANNMSPFTQDLSPNPQLQRTNLTDREDRSFLFMNIVGRKGFEPSIPAMSRRCLNQAGPPARNVVDSPD